MSFIATGYRHPRRFVRKDLERVFDALLSHPSLYGSASPGIGSFGTRLRGELPINAWEEGDALFAELEIPGVAKDDIDVSVIGDELTIRAAKKAREQAKETTFHRREIGAGEVVRTLTLPFEIDAERVDAKLESGVLTLRLPKAESAKPRKIAVRTSS